MTAERYAALCDNQPECYPEWGYLLGAKGIFAPCLALGLVITTWEFDVRPRRGSVEKPRNVT
jgi:hypothetical protein